MQSYFEWHKIQLILINETNWDQQRYLVMRCLNIDKKCGGASDRLQSLPLAVLMANTTRRLLLIKWNRPASLEEFLVPPNHGIDWRVPEWLDQKFDYQGSRLVVRASDVSFQRVERGPSLATIQMQMPAHGAAIYDKRKDDTDLPFDHVFRKVWNTSFTPAPTVAGLIHQQMLELDLTAGEYVSAHLRSKYTGDKSRALGPVTNAVNCASELRPGLPIYFALDASKVSRRAIDYGRSMNATVVARIGDTEPLHLDRGLEFLKLSDTRKNQNAFAFYNVFVDLYLLANSQCVAHGVGGYGKFASLFSRNRSCVIDHTEHQCNWTASNAWL